jgi:hypothetical protein
MLTETIHAGAFIVQEMPGYYSRDSLTVALSQTLVAGQVCGRVGVPANIVSSAAADAANTGGSGAITIDGTNPVSASAKNGRYRAVCIEPATNGGTFAVNDPDGVEIGKVAVGATFNNQIKFVIADATDFVAGDAFNIDVIREEGADEQAKALDLAGTDGSEVGSCIIVYPVTTDGSTTKKAAFMTRNCEVRAADLTWPSGITADQKAAQIENLRKKGIILR